MTSLLILPRVSSSLVWSDDRLKSKIRPDVNLVNCFGSPPASGCSQMFVAPSRVRRYCSPLSLATLLLPSRSLRAPNKTPFPSEDDNDYL